MSEFNWRQRLEQWNERLMASSLSETLPADVRTHGWVGLPPASEEEIAAAEERLGIALPPSYRDFLKASNGWQRLTESIERVWGTEQIGWFRRDNRDWIAAYTQPSQFGPQEDSPDEDYFAYEVPVDFRSRHLRDTLQISNVDDGVLLLNPQVINSAGEWEAWFFANWMPGAHRYRSFTELMDDLYHRFCNLDWKQPVGVIGDLPNVYTGSPGSPRRRLVKRRRRQSVKVLNKPLEQWDFDELVALLKHEFWQVRQETAYGLGKLKDPRAVEPLLALLNDDTNACIAAIEALKRLAPDRLRIPLLELLRARDAFAWMSAATTLGQLGELRAIPLIVAIIKDTSADHRYQGDLAGQFLAQFGAAGFDAITELLADNDPLVRARAARALMYTKDPRSIGVLQGLVNYPDSTVQECAASALDVLHAPRPKR